jgi:hypothetical protein
MIGNPSASRRGKTFPLMKIQHLIALAMLSGAPLAFAGHEIIDTSKESKETVPEEPLFKDHEFQLGDYGIYSVGNGPTHVGLFRDHAWGEGGEANYFFLRWIGIGVEYSGIYAKESPDTNRGRTTDHVVDLDHVGGNVFFRWPYVYVGGGADFGDRKWGEAYGGVGFEYRILQHFLPPIVPARIGIFVDARWSYLGDRYFPDDNSSRGDLNYFTTRAGFRFTY